MKSRFFQPKNGERIDAIREAIARRGLDPELEAVMLVSLMEAADRVDSTTGLQMAYLKEWAPRAHNDLELRLPDVLPRAAHGKGCATCLDAQEAARTLEADVAYLDPPYNQHSYLGNYHIWESLVRWDKPEVYGVACKRVDVKERRSIFNSRPKSADALRRLLAAIACPGAGGVVQQRGVPVAWRDGVDARVPVQRRRHGHHHRERFQAVRRSADRHLQSAGAEGGDGQPPAEHRIPVRRVAGGSCRVNPQSVFRTRSRIISMGSSPSGA